ncbi:mevalonate kinase family protein [Streptomyces laurentii]|uniref:mevalonate kinase family protein n=1 Tax=Streptomyces laurentii TaxID=39478 RepID=UPI0036B951BA
MSEVAAVFAPGSLLAIGEYAVLDGGRALVVAVDSGIECQVAPCEHGRRLTATDLGLDAPPEALSRTPGAGLLVEAVHAGEKAFPGLAPPHVTVQGRGWGAGEKIGLGGSAASVVAILGAFATAAGQDVTTPAVRRLLLRTAFAVHRAHQNGRGSGADVAASIYGGWIDYHLLDSVPHVRAARVPPGLRLAVAWSGLACSTTASIDRYRRWEAEHAAGGAEPFALSLHRMLDRFWAASHDGDRRTFLIALSEYGLLLEKLAHRIAPEEAEHMEQLTHAAARSGVASKSSGAVGGDCVIALGTDGALLDEARRAWRHLDATVVDVAPDSGGLRPVRLAAGS